MKALYLVLIAALFSAAPTWATPIMASVEQDISLLLYVDGETNAMDVVGFDSGFRSWLAWSETQDALEGGLGLSEVPEATVVGIADDGYWVVLTWQWTRSDVSGLYLYDGPRSLGASVNVIPEPAVGLLVAFGLTWLGAHRSR